MLTDHHMVTLIHQTLQKQYSLHHIMHHSLVQTILHYLKWVENSARHNPPVSQDSVYLIHGGNFCIAVSHCLKCRKHSPHQTVNSLPKLRVFNILHSHCNTGIMHKGLECWTVNSSLECPLLSQVQKHFYHIANHFPAPLIRPRLLL